MSRGTGRSLPSHRGRRIAKRLLLAGAVIGVPVAAAALLRRRAEPPSPPRWGRTHRYAGRWSEVVFQELGSGPPILLLHSFGPGYGAGQWKAVALVAGLALYVVGLWRLRAFDADERQALEKVLPLRRVWEKVARAVRRAARA